VTQDQLSEIITDVLAPRWPKVTDKWTPAFQAQTMYHQFKEFRYAAAKHAAQDLVLGRSALPTPLVWITAIKDLYKARGEASRASAHVDCPDCGGSGLIAVAAPIRVSDGVRVVGWGEALHPLDERPAGYYDVVMPCSCDNAPAGHGNVNGHTRNAVILTLAKFELDHGITGSDRDASPEAWANFMADLERMNIVRISGGATDTGTRRLEMLDQARELMAEPSESPELAAVGADDDPYNLPF